MLRIFSFLFLLSSFFPLLAQEWQAHTSFRQVHLLIKGSTNDLWAATQGGIYRYNTQNAEVKRYTSIEGLHAINPRSILFDAAKNILWLGYADGVLDQINLQNDAITSYRDIARASQFLQKGINNLSLRGDSLLVATQFGIVIFDTQKNEVRDSYTQLGALPSGTSIQNVNIINNIFYAVGTDGISFAPLSSPNLRNPTTWVTDTGVTDGEKIVSYNNNLYAINATGLFRKNGTSWENTGYSGQPQDILPTTDGLLITDLFSTRLLTSAGTLVDTQNPLASQLSASVIATDGGLWVADREIGLLKYGVVTSTNTNRPILQNIIPNSPYHQRFVDMLFDGSGNMWAIATENDGGGFYKLESNGNWKSYVAQNHTGFAGRRNYDRFTLDNKGTIWGGSNNRGVAALNPATEEITLYDETNSTLKPLANDNNGFIRIGGIAADATAGIWVANQFTQPNINYRSSTGLWAAFTPQFNGIPVSGVYNRFFIDSINNKWIQFKQDGGLLWMNTRTTPENNADDRVRWFKGQGANGFGLPAPQVMATAEDRKGKVWIGTQRGIASVLVTSLDNMQNEVRPVWLRTGDSFVLREVFVNDLSVDPANRLWVASTTGAWLVDINDGDNAKVLKQFTKDNSPLLSDNVLSIEVNPKNGRVYFATDVGLVSWQGDAVAPEKEVTDLFIFPNPAVAQSGILPEISIDKLVDDTQIKITTLTGKVVAQVQSFGGRATWNGRDENGEDVPSGIYLILAVANNGEGTAKGKVVLVR